MFRYYIDDFDVFWIFYLVYSNEGGNLGGINELGRLHSEPPPHVVSIATDAREGGR
jgi:hypothetical protein